jgi:glutaredoxin
MDNVVLYTRRGCHLCEDALAILRRHSLRPRLVDIDADPALRRQYNDCVPVVEIDGRERFRGRVNEVLLTRLLAARTSPAANTPRSPK